MGRVADTGLVGRITDTGLMGRVTDTGLVGRVADTGVMGRVTDPGFRVADSTLVCPCQQILKTYHQHWQDYVE